MALNPISYLRTLDVGTIKEGESQSTNFNYSDYLQSVGAIRNYTGSGNITLPDSFPPALLPGSGGTGTVNPTLVAQAPTTAPADVVVRTAGGETVRFSIRNGVLYMESAAGLQTGRAAANGLAQAAQVTPGVFGGILRTFGRTALTSVITELLFPQAAGSVAEDEGAARINTAIGFLNEAASSDPTGSLQVQQQLVNGVTTYTLSNRNTGVVIAQIDGLGTFRTNENLNGNGTLTIQAPPANVTAAQTNGALGSWVFPNLGNARPVAAPPGITINERPLTLPLGNAAPEVQIRQRTEGNSISYSVQYRAPDGQTREYAIPNVTSFEAATDLVVNNFRAGNLPGLSRIDEAQFTIPGTTRPSTIHHVQIANGGSNFYITYDTPGGRYSFIPIPGAASTDQATEIVRNAFLAGELEGLSTFTDAPFNIPGTSYNTRIRHIEGAGGLDNFNVVYTIGSRDYEFALSGAETLREASQQVQTFFANGQLPGLIPNQPLLPPATTPLPQLPDPWETPPVYVPGPARPTPQPGPWDPNRDPWEADPVTTPDQPLLPPATDPNQPLLPPARPFPQVPDPWETPPANVPGPTTPTAQPGPWDPNRDPWADEPSPDSGSNEPPLLPPGNGTGGNAGGDGVNGPGGSGQPPGNGGSGEPGGTSGTPRPNTRIFGTGLEQDLVVAAGQLAVNLVSAGSAALYYQGTEQRTSSTVTPTNVYDELTQLQQDPDTYIRSNYSNSFFGWNVGDNGYNISGHLFEMERDGVVTYFRRVPDDIYQGLSQAQAANGNTSGQVFVNELVRNDNGQLVPVWVQIRPPVRTEGYQFQTSVTGAGDGNNIWDRVDWGGSTDWRFGVDEGYSIGGNFTFRSDPSSSGTSDRIRLAFPTRSQGWELGYRTQDTTSFFEARAAYRSSMNGASVRDLTDPGGIDGTIIFGENSVYLVAGQRSRNEVNLTAPTGNNSGSVFLRARDTSFIELGPAAVFFGTEQANINYYHEYQLYPNDLREQINLFGAYNRSNGTQAPFNAPSYSLRGRGIQNDVALQITFQDGIDAIVAYRDVDALNRWFPNLTQSLGVDGAIDFISGLAHPENDQPTFVQTPIADLNYNPVTGNNAPSATALLAQSGARTVSLADGTSGRVVRLNNRDYLVINGRSEVFDVTGSQIEGFRNYRLVPGASGTPTRLSAIGNFNLAPASQINVGTTSRLNALSGNNLPSQTALQNGGNRRTVSTADGLSVTVTDLNGRSYGQLTVNGRSYLFDVTGQNLATTLLGTGSTPSLVQTSSLSAGSGLPSPQEIIERGSRLALSDDRVAFFYSAAGQDYVLYRTRTGELNIYNVTGYGRATIQDFLESLQASAGTSIIAGLDPSTLVASAGGFDLSGTTTSAAGGGGAPSPTPTINRNDLYPALDGRQLADAILGLTSILPGNIGDIARDGQKLASLYKFGDTFAKLVDGNNGSGIPNPFDTNGSTEAEDFVLAAASVVSWAIPEAADEIAVAKKIYSLVDSAISVIKTPGQLAALQANIISQVTAQALEQGITLTVTQAEQLAKATMPASFNPTVLSAANWLGLVSVGLSFIKEDWAKIASTVTGIASSALLIAAGAVNPVIGVIGIFATFLGGVLGLSKPSTVPLGDNFNVTGSGTADDSVIYSIGKKDFLYKVDSDQSSLDIRSVMFKLHRVEVEPNMKESGRDGRVSTQDGWRLADDDSDGSDRVAPRVRDRDGDNVTKYYLDASFTFGGLFGGATDEGVGQLTPFSIDDGDRDGPGTQKVTGFEISEEDYNRIQRLLGNSGTIGGGDERISILKDFADDVGPITFRQTDNDQGLWFYTDINGDGTPDLVKQDIEIAKHRDGDNSVGVTLYDALGRQIVNFDADSLSGDDLRDPMDKALAEVTVGPTRPIGLTQPIGPGYTVQLPDSFSQEGALTPEMIQAYAGLSQEALLASITGGGDKAPAWTLGWLPASYDGIERETGGNLTGDNRANLLFGANGADTVNGAGGNDRIVGGGGNDILRGGAGEDLLAGNDGADTVRGGAGYDVAYGGAGADRLIGGAGDDRLFGGTGADIVIGGIGNDLVGGGRGRDVLSGGAGADTLSFAESSAGVMIDLGRNVARGGTAQGDRISGFEGVIGGRGNDTLIGDSPAVVERDGQIVILSTGENRLQGSAGNDKLYGLGGNDELEGGLGRDLLNGGDGNDVVSYAKAALGVKVDLSRGTAFDRTAAESGVLATTGGIRGDAAGDRLISIEGVIGSEAADRLRGSDAQNLLVGNGGSDVLLGGGGNDTLQGGTGTDTLRGGSGNDIASFADVQPDADTGLGITADLATQKVGGAVAGETISSIEGVIGTAGVDVLLGSNGINRLEGLDGADVIDGRGGNDKLYGGGGNDVIIDLKGENDLIGGRGDDRLIAGRGRDLLSGDAGNDILRAGSGNDLLQGGAGIDTLFGGVGNDRIVSGTGNDSIVGGSGADRLFAGSGNDRIEAGRGDIVDGGAGRDTAVINARGTEFEVQLLAGGRVRLIDKDRGGSGVFEARNVERFQFNDGIYRINGRGELARVGDVPLGDQKTGQVSPQVSLALNDAMNSIERTLDSFLAVQVGVPTTQTDSIPAPDAAVLPPEQTINFSAQPAGTGVNVDLSQGTVAVNPTPAAPEPPVAPVVIPAAVVNVVGTQSADQITGNAAANTLVGLAGRDTLAGGAGADRLVGGIGADMLSGGAGNDRLVGGAGRDTIILQGAADRYVIVKTDNGFRIRDTKTGTADVAVGVEFVRFWNGKGDAKRLASLVP